MDTVRELRLPQIKQMQRQLHEEKRKLSKYLGPNLDLQLPEDLEAHSIEFRLSFSSLEELGQSIAALRKAEVLAILKNLLKML